MHGKASLAALILLAVVTGITLARIGNTSTPPPPFEGYVALQSEYWDCDPEERACPEPAFQRALSVNATEDEADVIWDLREPKLPAIIWLATALGCTAIFPKTKTFAKVPAARVDESPSARRLCATLPPKEAIAGHLAIRIGTTWRIPTLACLEAKSITQAGNRKLVKVTTAIVAGPPPPENLRIPAGFREVPWDPALIPIHHSHSRPARNP